MIQELGKTAYIRWLFSNEQCLNEGIISYTLHQSRNSSRKHRKEKAQTHAELVNFSASPDLRFWSHFLRRGRTGILFKKMITPYCNYNYAILPTFSFLFNLFVLFFTYSIFSFSGTVLNCTYFVEFYIKSRGKAMENCLWVDFFYCIVRN